MWKFNPFSGKLDYSEKFSLNKVIFVNSANDLPTANSGVHIITTGTTLYVPSTLDLGTNRLFFEKDCAILGTSSETAKIISSLGNGIALITAVGSLPIQNISLEVTPLNVGNVPILFNLDGIIEPGGALDWYAVNCTNSKIGTIKNYSNVVLTLCAFIQHTDGIVFDGTFDSIVFSNSIARSTVTSGTSIKIAPTAVINRRIRIVDTPILAIGAAVGIDVSTSATIPNEGYILRYVNFSGGGTYIQGVQPTDNKSIFYECRGVANSANLSQYGMINNATATVISAPNTFEKIAGTTTSGVYVQRFTNTNNRATYTGAITRFFEVDATVSANAGNNQTLNVRIAKNGATLPESEMPATTSGAGRSENIKSQTIVQLTANDYIEVFISNSSLTNVTVTELTVIIKATS